MRSLSIKSQIIVPTSPEEAKRLINVALGIRERSSLDEKISLLQALGGAHQFEREGYSEVRAFFDEVSEDYDSDLENPYWAFAHDILKFIITKFIGENFSQHQVLKVFDAGAGTGNWSRFVLGLTQNAYVTLFDMNSSMLNRAYSKLATTYKNSIRFVEGNLEILSDYPSQRFNLALCMHNVIGLGRNTDLILRNLCTSLEDNGLAFIMVTNKYHAFNFAQQFLNESEVLRVVVDGTVRFKPDMPEMFCYTPHEFRGVLLRAGFSEVKVLGFPVTVYPSPQDTKLLKRDTLDEQLTNPRARAALLNLEKSLCLHEELAYRGGSSLIAICKKS